MSELEEQVIVLVATKRDVSPTSVRNMSRLVEDLGIDGDDAVEFFKAFEAQFRADLSPLYCHWSKHFGPEGWGWSDVRLNWLMLIGAGVLVAGVGGVFMPLGVLIGGAILLATITAGFWMRWKAGPSIPVTVADLIVAAETRQWPVSYSKSAQNT